MPSAEDPVDANGYRLSAKEYQKVTNESWPHRDSAGGHARGIVDQPADRQLDVTARLVFERDGEVYLPARAIRWNRSHVCVLCNDPRLQTGYVWLRATEVRRRDPDVDESAGSSSSS